jgi:diadenosine tetraphosphate (Ap4A) HIT family hydrolase
MLNRIWDSEGKYNEGLLKEYEHWVLEVSYRQHTLGCYIIFAKRSVEKISDLHDDEIIELKHVMKAIESTLSTIQEFKPDRFNYMQMGNALHHLHFHGIPRYASERTFSERLWIDKTWGKPPIWNNMNENPELIREIKNSIKHLLP